MKDQKAKPMSYNKTGTQTTNKNLVGTRGRRKNALAEFDPVRGTISDTLFRTALQEIVFPS